ncbi:MAG: hypothetical protein ACI4L9_04865 [Candidatus Coproplasma sp.]
MNEEKKNRIVAAVTVASVMLVVVLVAVVIYQIVDISMLQARKRQLVNEYEEILQQIEDSEDLIDKIDLEYDEVMYILAFKNGYRPAEDTGK